MKNIKFINAFGILFVLMCCLGCGKTTPGAINPTKLYTGKVIALACPSYAFIEVTNADIGDDLNLGIVYHHVIGISNSSWNVQVNTLISFHLSNSKSYQDCLSVIPCPETITAGPFPSKIYCSTTLNILK